MRSKHLLLLLLALVVYVLHQDFWNWKQYQPLIFGFLPIGLAYHAGYSIVVAIMMAVFVKFAWPKHLESVAAHDEGGDKVAQASSLRQNRDETGQAGSSPHAKP